MQYTIHYMPISQYPNPCIRTMADQEKLNLTWDTYSDHMREALKEMMSSSEFADVTLVTDDKKQIRAHRNILSACSPVFKNILQVESYSSPVIYFRGIQYSEMELIIQFIYSGEARLSERRIKEFFLVSKNLEIKELMTTEIEMNHHIYKIEDIKENVVNDAYNDDNIDMNSEYPLYNDCEKVDSLNTVSKRKVLSQDAKLQCQDCGKVFKSITSCKLHIESIHEGVKYQCDQCDKQFTMQTNLTRHVEWAHEDSTYVCTQCDKQYFTQADLRRHIKFKHEEAKYHCNQCDHKAALKHRLNRHIKLMHENEKYPCNQCDYEGRRKDYLTDHIKRKH